MPARITIKVRPGESVSFKPSIIKTSTSLQDLETSSRKLYAQVESRRERDRILGMLDTEKRDTNQSYITYDRLKRLLGG